MTSKPETPEIISDEFDEDVVYFRVPLRLTTVAWLMEISENCHCDPALVIGNLIDDIREDDQTEHAMIERESISVLH